MNVEVLSSTEDAVVLRWSDGTTRRLSATWLRDNVPLGRHRDGGQRTFDITEMDEPRITDTIVANGMLQVRFADASADFTLDWLEWAADGDVAAGNVLPPKDHWDAAMQPTIQFADFERVRADGAARLEWLRRLRDRGFGLLTNTPVMSGTVLDVVELFGFVRETNYGRLFDVEVEPDPANLANTSGRIGMHTDNPYRDPVPGLQLLHCLVNESEGGESQLCDGHNVAARLRAADPDGFDLLTTYPVRFRYFEPGAVDLQSYRPLIELDALGEILTIRYNSRSATAFRIPDDIIDDYYRAYRRLGTMLNAPAARIEFRLGPGDCVVFDNQRVLHGRSAFRGGRRHLQGCYADKDGLHSTIRVLEAT